MICEPPCPHFRFQTLPIVISTSATPRIKLSEAEEALADCSTDRGVARHIACAGLTNWMPPWVKMANWLTYLNIGSIAVGSLSEYKWLQPGEEGVGWDKLKPLNPGSRSCEAMILGEILRFENSSSEVPAQIHPDASSPSFFNTQSCLV